MGKPSDELSEVELRNFSIVTEMQQAFLNFSFALPAEDPVCVCLPDASYLWHRAGELGRWHRWEDPEVCSHAASFSCKGEH